ncbi:MAG TPA: hypothetical protein V6C93_04950 [Allocoleopsis sp.]
MLSTLPSRQSCLNRFGVTKTLTPLTLGIVLLTSIGMPAQAQFGGFPAQSPTTQVIGSPIPSPVPVVPGTMNPYSLSPYNSNTYYNPNNSYYNPYNYNGYNPGGITSGRGVIRNSTLINPTVINSRITDSVLVDPVIIDSPGFSRRVFRQPPVIYNPPYLYNQPGIRVHIGY